MSKYHVHQVDSNQQAIVTALEAGGCSAAKIGRPVDLLVGKNGRNDVFEVKHGRGNCGRASKPFSRGGKARPASCGVSRTRTRFSATRPAANASGGERCSGNGQCA